MNKPKIFVGADHGGFALKEQAKLWLEEWGYAVEDLGAFALDPADDYPQPALAVAEQVAGGQEGAQLGLLFCRSGGGMVIAANKVNGIRAVELASVEAAEHAKVHNNANVGSLAADWLSQEQAKAIIKTFVETEFSGAERHVRRLAQIAGYEQSSLA